jgi:hypothetical protein
VNKCEINKEKTKIIEIKKKMVNYPAQEKICEFEIVSSYKYLGVTLDSSLKMDEYFI